MLKSKTLSILGALAMVAATGLAIPHAQAGFMLGDAANFGVIAGPTTTSMQFSNSTFNGNVATDNPTTTAGGNYVQFSSGTINGNFSFVGTAQNNLGSGTLNGMKIANDATVSSAFNTISSLSATFAGEDGTATSFGGSGSLAASSGTLDANGNHVFTTTASNFLAGGALTIDGTGLLPGQDVVINVTGNSNVALKNLLNLTGGLTDDQVFINITGTGNVGGNTNGGVVNGIIVGLNAKFNVDNTTIDGRVFGGDTGEFHARLWYHTQRTAISRTRPLDWPRPLSPSRLWRRNVWCQALGTQQEAPLAGNRCPTGSSIIRRPEGLT
jgi:hypothetical protein